MNRFTTGFQLLFGQRRLQTALAEVANCVGGRTRIGAVSDADEETIWTICAECSGCCGIHRQAKKLGAETEQPNDRHLLRRAVSSENVNCDWRNPLSAAEIDETRNASGSGWKVGSPPRSTEKSSITASVGLDWMAAQTSSAKSQPCAILPNSRRWWQRNHHRRH